MRVATFWAATSWQLYEAGDGYVVIEKTEPGKRTLNSVRASDQDLLEAADKAYRNLEGDCGYNYFSHWMHCELCKQERPVLDSDEADAFVARTLKAVIRDAADDLEKEGKARFVYHLIPIHKRNMNERILQSLKARTPVMVEALRDRGEVINGRRVGEVLELFHKYEENPATKPTWVPEEARRFILTSAILGSLDRLGEQDCKND